MNSHKTPGRHPVESIPQPGPLLVVDGDSGIRQILQCILEMHGYAVLTCGSAEDALRIALRNTNIQLLITAVMMPVMNGLELARKIRESQPLIEVLYHSTIPSEVWAARGMHIDPEHFLQLPFEHNRLEERVKAILTDAKTSRASGDCPL